MASRKALSRLASVALDEQIAALDLREKTQEEIARITGLTQPAVNTRLKKIKKRYIASATEHFQQMVGRKMAQYRDVRREAWEAYDLSKKDGQRIVEEYAPVDSDDEEDTSTLQGSERRIKRIVTTEGRLPDNSYLVTILKTLEAERAMLGLDEALKIDMTNNVVNWDTLAQEAANRSDPIEAKFKVLEDKRKEKALEEGNGLNGHGLNGNGNGKHD